MMLMLMLTWMPTRCGPDLRQYMEAGMDGCISKPLKEDLSLINTVNLAAPKHLTALEQPMTGIPRYNNASITLWDVMHDQQKAFSYLVSSRYRRDVVFFDDLMIRGARLLRSFVKEKSKVMKTGAFGTGDANGSAAMAATTLSLSAAMNKPGQVP
jgi:hypothetical protein